MDASPGRRHQLDALADPTRRAILELLRERPLTAGEIAARFSQQRPAISKHLTLLRSTGWLAESRDRQRRIYSLRNDAVVVVVDWARRLGEACQAGVAQSPGGQGVRPVPHEGRPDVANRLSDQSRDTETPGETVGGSSVEAAISDSKFQKTDVGTAQARSDIPSPAGHAARSSFELIFD